MIKTIKKLKKAPEKPKTRKPKNSTLTVHKLKSRQRILDAATMLFAQRGYDAVGVREICKAAGANICMVSYFWGGKMELYKGILDDLIEKQTRYAQTFLNLECDPGNLSRKEQNDTLYLILDKLADFLYSDIISDDLFRFLLQEQQRKDRGFELYSPVFAYFRKLVAAIFEKPENDREIILKTVFILSQINSPKILPAFSLELLKEKKFSAKDKEIIKSNAKLYVKTLLMEAEK